VIKLILALLASAACATANPEPTASSLTAPRCQPACKAGYHCIQLAGQPGGPLLPPICVPN